MSEKPNVALKPISVGCTEKSQDVRWTDDYEDDNFNVDKTIKGLKQSAKIPG